ncbi:MAG TPA: YceI family protein [bacterium]|nr:YceI family protein [bacterium]
MCRGLLTAVAVLGVWAAGSATQAAPYVLDPAAKNRVEFHSKATLESFSGKAKTFTAEFEVDPAQLRRTRGKVTVDLRTLDTGIDLRNKHMRENHLHTDSFPNAVYAIDSVATAADGATVTTVYGRMTIHGQTRAMTVPASVAETGDGTGYRLQSEFPLKITDFGIPRPEFLFLKLAEEVRIVVDLVIVPQRP